PLLGPVDLLIDGECSSWSCPDCGSKAVNADIPCADGYYWKCNACGGQEDGEAAWTPDIHWVICGGESGPKARPMHPDWARSLRDQCQAANVPFLFKQWGEWAPWDFDSWDMNKYPCHSFGPHEAEAPVFRRGKKKAGRLL